MSKVMVSFRLEDRLRDKLKLWAMEDHRTVSNCVESLLSQEEQRREGGEVTLWSLDQKLDQLLSEKKEKKVKKESVVKFNPYTIELPDCISRETWTRWINHLKSQRRYPNETSSLFNISNYKN